MMAILVRAAVESSVRACVLALLVASLLAVLRIRSSAVRHVSWTMVLCAMLLMPALPSVVPSVPIQVPGGFPSADIVLEVFDERPTARVTEAIAPVFRSDVANAATAAPRATRPDARLDWPAVAFGVYLAAVAILVLRLIIGWRVSSRVRRSGVVVDDRFSESPHVTAPVTVGAFSPRIILPASWRDWPDDKFRAVLAHEIAHVRRHDPLVALLAAVNHAIFWFHPVAWWLRRTLAVSAEHACDEAAVQAIRNPRRYAEVLVDLADVVRRGGGRLSWQLGVHGTGAFGERIERALSGIVSPRVSRTRKTAVVVGCILAIAVVVSCQKDPAVLPLLDDPERAKRDAEYKVREAYHNAILAMTWEEAEEVQAAWRKNPEDLETAKKLVFYCQYSLWKKEVRNPQALIDLRRPIALWVIEHHPEHDVAASVRLSPAPPAWPDPEGYAKARSLWLAHTSRADASGAVLRNAGGGFFKAPSPGWQRNCTYAHDPSNRSCDSLAGSECSTPSSSTERTRERHPTLSRRSARSSWPARM